MKRPLILLILLCVLLFAALPLTKYVLRNSDAGRSGRCGQCGMDLSKYRRTQYRISWTDGTVTRTCGVQCGLIQHLLHKNKFKSAIAKDYFSGSTFNARTGCYVFGSSVLTDMAPGFIAFQSPADAEKFRKESGGEVMSFNKAFSALAERKERR